ncbi:MAG: adenylosuccinate lyase [Acidobacteria bacterium]|nr:MAG: adenylosuccinate lyase [Acidobacteriota bacterium]
MNRDAYQNPLITRYASREMSRIFSDNFKFRTWRKLWLLLAEAEQELGLAITDEQLEEMREHLDDIDFDYAAKKEKELRHDVMAHIHAFGKAAPAAMSIIHLGATSAFVGDNTDLIQTKEALLLVKKRLLKVMKNLREFACEYREMPTLGFTHFQPAQLTTVGKRAALWLQDLLMDFKLVALLDSRIPGRGVKGTTGTQASFLKLFDKDEEKVKELDELVTERMGFPRAVSITGQTYSRKIDDDVLHVLRQVGISCSKFGNDLRLLAHDREMEEPFGEKQVGSSAMAYKRNPMRSERMTALSRFLISLSDNTAYTAATQWFERTLDDSANRRVVLPQAFLSADAILLIYANITDNLVVNREVIAAHVQEQLPFMATENILMEAVKQGAGRQEIHEVIREYSHQATAKLKAGSRENPLIELLAEDSRIPLNREKIEKILNPSDFVGRAPNQVKEFLRKEIDPILDSYEELLDGSRTNLFV